jgi:hypothetical protein
LRFGLLPLFIAARLGLAQQGLPDPAFDKVPFDQWLKGADQSHIQFSIRASPAFLTIHQRLSQYFQIEVAGPEFVKRPGPGRLVAFLEIRDQDNRAYRFHSQMEFSQLKKASDLLAVNLSVRALMTPGDYRVAAAIYDIETKEHSLKRKTVHVPKVAHDPLPGFWRDLPPVEFLTETAERPDAWFWPRITSRPNLALRTERPVRIEVLVNESPTEAAHTRVGQTVRRNMAALIPALKVISQIDAGSGSLNVTMLDLERRKVTFQQDNVHTLDWPAMRAALLETNPNLIDVHALENHEQNAQFFVSQVRQRLEGGDPGPPRVLIVLSGPMAFPKGQDLHPIEVAPEPGSRVFYIRYYPPRPGAAPLGFAPLGGRGGRNGGGGQPGPPPPIGRGPSTEDSLEGTLKPLSPRLFNVSTPMEFRNALGAIITDISQLK